MGQWSSFPYMRDPDEIDKDPDMSGSEDLSDGGEDTAVTPDDSAAVAFDSPPVSAATIYAAGTCSAASEAEGAGSEEAGELAERENKHRLEELLVYADEVLCDVFREGWSRRHGTWTDGEEAGCQLLELYNLRPQFREQRQALERGEVGKWDTTLLSFLVLNVGWLEGEKEAAVKAIRATRNSLSHAARYCLADSEFAGHWETLESALLTLGGTKAVIDAKKATALDDDTTVGLQQDGEAAKVARDHKEEGNRKYRAEDYSAAVHHYASAISLAGAIPSKLLAHLYCNKAAAHLQLKESELARASAKCALRLDPLYANAHRRLAESYHQLSRFGKAANAYESALALLQSGSNSYRTISDALAECRLDADKEARQEDLHPYYAGPQYGSQAAHRAAAARFGISQGEYEAISSRLRSGGGGDEVLSEINSSMDRLVPGLRRCAMGHAAQKRGDNEAAFREFLLAATEDKNPEGMYNAGLCLSNGTGVRRDMRRAFDFFVRATECPIAPPCGPITRTLGIGQSHNALARWYDAGIHVQQSDQKALFHWKKSAELDGPSGCNNLGLVYLNGSHGEERNVAKARELFRKAVDLGAVTEAMTNLANICISDGEFDAALRWAESAVAHGDARAMDTVQHCKGLMKATPAGVSTTSGPVKEILRSVAEMRSIAARRVTPQRETPSPSLAELMSIRPQTPYLETLIRAKSLYNEALSSRGLSLQQRVEIAAKGRRLEDAELVLSREEAIALHWLSKEPGVEQDADWACLSTISAGDPLTSQITCYESLVQRFANDWWLAERLGLLLLFPGPTFDSHRGLEELTRAHQLLRETPSHKRLLYELGVGNFLSLSGNGSEFELRLRRARDFLTRFLHAAEGTGHRKVGIANYCLGMIFAKTNLFDGESCSKEEYASLEAYYDAGMAADAALPPFLREERHTYRLLLEQLLKLLHSAEESSSAATRERAAVVTGGEVLPGSMPGSGQFTGERTLALRARDADYWGYCMAKRPEAKWKTTTTVDARPQELFGNVCAREEATEITLEELFVARCDRAYLDRFLRCVVVSVPKILASVQCVVEDCTREPRRLAIYGWDAAFLRQITVGRIVTIYEPYARRAMDGPMIRVNDVALVVVGEQRKMCYHCLSASTARMRACSACKVARYCSKECQLLDWKQGSHKASCQALRHRKAGDTPY